MWRKHQLLDDRPLLYFFSDIKESGFTQKNKKSKTRLPELLKISYRFNPNKLKEIYLRLQNLDETQKMVFDFYDKSTKKSTILSLISKLDTITVKKIQEIYLTSNKPYETNSNKGKSC